MAFSLGHSSMLSVSAPAHAPFGASQVIDHAFGSFSFPAHFFADYCGNRSHPNLFSRDILDLLYEKTGAHPYIRVGGTSADHTTYNASQKLSVETFNVSSNGIPGAVHVGPTWFEGFESFPGTEWTFQVSLRGTVENAVAEAQLCMDHAKHSLISFEIGNEPDIAASQGFAPKNYSLADYVDEWLEYADAISENVLKGNRYGLDERRFFQAFAYAGHDLNGFSVEGAFNDGINKHGYVKSVSQHEYNAGNPPLTLQNDFMNHLTITGNISKFQNDMDFLKNYDSSIKYTFGETNSDFVNLNMAQYEGVFGSALWLIDYMLYGMTRNISHMNIIQGTTFGYAGWVPVPTPGRQPYVRAPLYGHIVVADVLGQHGDVRVKEVQLGMWNFSAYAIYQSNKLAKYVLINFDEWNATTPHPRPQQMVKLEIPTKPRIQAAKVERLWGAGASADSGITWAGQSWNYTHGRLGRSGFPQHETLLFRNGKANLAVASTEAVVVTLS
ncbi:glycoside hydrolase family 79 protein [Xylogone sp. PMI_703]|nr:glycoside hydrolase family 79 protein [Xylogone sp. PMI_703]